MQLLIQEVATLKTTQAVLDDKVAKVFVYYM